jgi:AcrR family transcriptional regulator
MKQDTKARIFEAASRVVQESGVAHMTLEEVAAEAKVSKGGLLYHFPSKEALIEGLVENFIAQFDQFFVSRKEDNVPGSFTRAYLESAMLFEVATATGIMSAIANNRSLLVPLHKAYARWQSHLEHDGIDPVLATMVRLVSDGLWFSFLIGTPALHKTMVKRVLERLEKETHSNTTKNGVKNKG